MLRNDARAQGLEIVRLAVRTEPLAEVWIDEEGRVMRVPGLPGKALFGSVPVPVF